MSDVRAALIASLLISAEADKSDTNDFLAVSADPLNTLSAATCAEDAAEATAASADAAELLSNVSAAV